MCHEPGNSSVGTPRYDRPVRILHTSDWHVGRRIRGNPRQDEHEQVLAEIVAAAVEEDVDLVVVAGDLFDVSVPPPWAESLVYRTLGELAEVAPVVAVAGNHDHPARLAAVAPLLRLAGVHLSTTIARPDDGGTLLLDDVGVRVAFIPWQSQRGIVTAADLMERSATEHAQTFADRMRRIVAALTEDLSHDLVNLVVAHLTVHGAAPAGSERDVHTVLDYSVPSSIFPGELSYVALGHFHRLQRVPNPVPTWYPGSPLHLDFGEAGETKGVLLVDAEPGRPAEVRTRPLASGRPLVVVAGNLEQVVESAASLGDAWVKVVVDEPRRAGLADEVRRHIPHAVDVVLSRPVNPARPRRPGRLNRPRREVFQEYLVEHGIEDPRLPALFDELLEEVTGS